ncbi:MAG: glycosyltransferase [Pseudomonadota bacterium]
MKSSVITRHSANSKTANDIHDYEQPLTLSFTLPTRMYNGMLVVWLLRPALQKRFPLHKQDPKIYLAFLAWCTSIGRRQYRLLRELEAWNQELMQPMDMPEALGCFWGEAYTVGMYLAGLSRSKYFNGQILYNAKMRHRAARWYFREGRQLMGLDTCPSWQQQALAKHFKDANLFTESLLLPKDAKQAEAEARIWQNTQDIRDAWGAAAKQEHLTPVTVPIACSLLSKWLGAYLPVEANEVSWLTREITKLFPSHKPTQADIKQLLTPLSSPQPFSRGAINKPFGVNLVGYARGELGIGEDVRMLAVSLERAGVPFNIINVEPGANVSQGDTSAEKWMADQFDYAINIFCMTGIEMTRMTLEKGLGWLEGHYNIGLWPWELPEWPTSWRHSWSLVNELWGISEYTAAAYREAPLPVVPMPLPVEVDTRNVNSNREYWQLPKDDYLFVFSFDMNSTLARKNPITAVEAFLAAFKHQPDKRVGLVIKVSHLDKKQSAWNALAKRIAQDQRIYLVSGELRKQEVLSLYKSCDCFVSLHRAEGFGRGLAEAQLLGLALIATGYSGNMAFCDNNATHTVRYTMMPVGAEEYFFGEGQQWADPDVHHAAELMQRCADAPKGETPLNYPLEQFNPQHCGEAYRSRLEKIAKASAIMAPTETVKSS